MNELSFIIFTVSIQCAVGTFVTLALVDLLVEPKVKTMSYTFMVVLVMLIIGFTISYTDDGQALRILMPGLQIGSITTPPLDIVALILFGLAIVVYGAVRACDVNIRIQHLSLLPGISLGVILLLVTSQSYSPIPAPMASNLWTTFQFIVTTLITGPIAAITLLHWQRKRIAPVLLHTIGKRLAATSLIAMTITLISFAIYLFWLSTLQLPDNPLASMENGYFLVAARILFTLTGVLVLAISTLCEKQSPTLASACLVLLLLAEFSGRAFFLAVHQETTLVSSSAYSQTSVV